MMKLRNALLLMTLVLSLFSGSAFAQEQKIFDRIIASKTIHCGYFVWAPYIEKDANTGQISGINFEIMEAIGRNLGLKIEWSQEVGMGEIVTALNSGKVDMMCPSVWPDPGKLQNLTLTRPSFYNTVVAAVRADDKRFDGDLSKANKKEIRVAAIDADSTDYLAKEKLPNATEVSLPQIASGGELPLQLTTKKADITLIEEALLNDFSKHNPNQIRKVAGIGPVRLYGEHLAVKQGEYKLRDMLDVSILQLTNDGVIEEIVNKYATKYHSALHAPKKEIE